MRLTDFWDRMAQAFGPAYADSLARDQALSALQGKTVLEALESGETTKDVWRVVHDQFELPAKLR